MKPNIQRRRLALEMAATSDSRKSANASGAGAVLTGAADSRAPSPLPPEGFNGPARPWRVGPAPATEDCCVDTARSLSLTNPNLLLVVLLIRDIARFGGGQLHQRVRIIIGQSPQEHLCISLIRPAPVIAD